MANRILALCALFACADAIHLTKPRTLKVKEDPKIECHDAAMRNVTWGVWIDGRDATHGPNYYGEDYGTKLAEHLEKLHKVKPSPGKTLTYGMWNWVEPAWKWRDYKNPVEKEVAHCHTAVYTKERRAEIMKGINIMNDRYHDLLEQKEVPTPEAGVKDVLLRYSLRLKKSTDRKTRLRAIAYLNRNLAFLHPLMDKNGRSRMLITQYELRRNNIACGTMMYNNNKDIYFQTENEFIQKLEEGIEMYNKAQETNENPWQDESALVEHETRFPNPDKEKLTKCWHQFCNFNSTDHTNTDHETCTGTRIAF